MHTELGSSQVDVQQCALSWAVGEELGDDFSRLARRKWRWSKAEVEVEQGGSGGGRGGGEEDSEEDS